jgi:hypothetical protein
MTMDVYADLFEDDLEQMAGRLDWAAMLFGVDSLRTDHAGLGPRHRPPEAKPR